MSCGHYIGEEELRSDDFDEHRRCIYCFHANMWHDESGCRFDYPCKCAGFDTV